MSDISCGLKMAFLQLTVKIWPVLSYWLSPIEISLACQPVDKAAIRSRQQRSKAAVFHKVFLRRNPPEVQVTIGKNLAALNFVPRVFTFKKKSFLTAPNVENKFWISYETHENTGEVKLIMKFYLCLHNFSELWNLFSRVPMGSCFPCYLIQLLL